MATTEKFGSLCDVEFYAKKVSDAALQTLTLVGFNASHGTYEAAIHDNFEKLATALGYTVQKRDQEAA